MVNLIPYIDGIVEGLERIHEESIAKGDFQKAASDLHGALLQNNFYGLREQIFVGPHCGSSFVLSVELLKEALGQGNQTSIEHYYKLVRAYGAQTHLPE